MTEQVQAVPAEPAILTTTVGSYPVPEWLVALPSEQAVSDATRVVFDTQRQAGIDLPTDGELYRFDTNHPDTNGMIEYFVRPMGGTRSAFGRSEVEEFAAMQTMGFRAKPAAVIDEALSEGGLDLLSDCARAAAVSGGPFKFTLTSPYMLRARYSTTTTATLKKCSWPLPAFWERRCAVCPVPASKLTRPIFPAIQITVPWLRAQSTPC